MRVLLVGVFDEGYALSATLRADALRRMGHEVETFDYRQPAPAWQRRRAPWLARRRIAPAVLGAAAKRFDVVVVLKGELISPALVGRIREASHAPVVNWWPDDPHRLRLSTRLAPAYDLFFTHDTYALEEMRRHGIRSVRYLPFACEPTVHHRYEITTEEKSRFGAGVSFVGTYSPARARVLASLADLPVKVWGPGWRPRMLPVSIQCEGPLYGEAMFKVLSHADIALNIHQNFDGPFSEYGHGANSRVFEVTGCGGLLLTDRKRDLADLFAEGSEIICYGSLPELRQHVQALSTDDSRRNSIKIRGQERALRDHTLAHRFTAMLQEVGKLGSGTLASS